MWRSKVLSNIAERTRGAVTGPGHDDATTLRAAWPFSARAESSSTRVPPRDRISHLAPRAFAHPILARSASALLFPSAIPVERSNGREKKVNFLKSRRIRIILNFYSRNKFTSIFIRR